MILTLNSQSATEIRSSGCRVHKALAMTMVFMCHPKRSTSTRQHLLTPHKSTCSVLTHKEMYHLLSHQHHFLLHLSFPLKVSHLRTDLSWLELCTMFATKPQTTQNWPGLRFHCKLKTHIRFALKKSAKVHALLEQTWDHFISSKPELLSGCWFWIFGIMMVSQNQLEHQNRRTEWHFEILIFFNSKQIKTQRKCEKQLLSYAQIYT